jgi:hypothetical protein
MSDPTVTPIIANASPAPDQIAAGLRQLVLVLGSIASALGYSKLAGEFSSLLAIVGPLSVIVAFVWGQLHTRAAAQQKATLAAAAPNAIGVVR